MAAPAILAVDDDPEVLRAVARDLRRQYGNDYRVLRAASASEALDALEELQARGDAVALLLSDQRMPAMDGVAFLAEARRRFPDARRVLLTAYADTEAAIAAINRSQVDYYLLKPWDPPEECLYPVLDDLLAAWRAAYRPGYGGVRVVGSRWSAEAYTIKHFLARSGVPYAFLAVEEPSEEAAALLAGDPALPLVALPDGRRLEAPDVPALAEALGLQTRAEAEFYDLAIVGGGPAGLAAAVYGASEGLRTVLVEREATGGQAGTSSMIENYLGFPSGLTGADLARRATTQARRFGVEVLAPQEVRRLELDGPYKRITLGSGSVLSAHVLMLATGVEWRLLEAPGAEALTGRGVYYGAALAEAIGCAGETVYVVGAGNSAGQGALHFAEHAARVIMLVRGDSLGAGMSHYLVERIEAHEAIEVRLHTEVTACHGDDHLTALALRNSDGDEETVEARYLFVFIGAAPHTEWLDGLVARDERGYVLTGPDIPEEALREWPLARPPFLL
jgi:thioredoxin reductase (NADPH)